MILIFSRGGENIYPAEVEALLLTHPDIIDAQVVGVPSRRLGEEVNFSNKLIKIVTYRLIVILRSLFMFA